MLNTLAIDCVTECNGVFNLLPAIAKPYVKIREMVELAKSTVKSQPTIQTPSLLMLNISCIGQVLC